MFYGIICSGLTDKTKLSFASSNSTFIECVRKPSSQSNTISYQDDRHTIIIGADNHHFENTSAIVNDNTHKSPGHLTLTTSATFTSCVWRKCEASNGGGIYLKAGTAISLSVIKGEFYSCKSTPERGGGIYIEGIGDVRIKQTLFLECISEATNGAGSGGIEMWTVQKPPQIEECSFLSCKSGDDAGGLGIWNTPLYQQTCVMECQFIECTINHTTSSGGGGLIIWISKAAVGCTECLFSKCYSACVGGGLASHISSSDSFKNTPLFSFCFFNNNAARESCGNDCYLVEWIPNPPCVHSFSTTASSRLCYDETGNGWNNPTVYTVLDNWLPSGALKDKTPLYPPLNTVLLMHTSDNEWSLILYPFK